MSLVSKIRTSSSPDIGDSNGSILAPRCSSKQHFLSIAIASPSSVTQGAKAGRRAAALRAAFERSGSKSTEQKQEVSVHPQVLIIGAAPAGAPTWVVCNA